jgi:hypothetical protein
VILPSTALKSKRAQKSIADLSFQSIILLGFIGFKMMVKTQNRTQVLASFSVGAIIIMMVFASSIILASGQVAPVFSPLNVGTDKYEYEFGEAIKISGYITPGFLEQKYGNLMHLQIFNPLLSLYREDFVNITSKGTFTYELRLEGKYAFAGHYWVTATYGEYQGINSFELTESTKVDYTCAVRACTYDLEIIDDNGSITRYPISYKIYGVIEEMTVNSERSSLTMKAETDGNGRILIAIPRSVLDAREGGSTDTRFIIFLNGQGVTYEEISDDNVIALTYLEIEDHRDVRVIGIDFPEGTAQIEIIGTEVIPEFPINLLAVTAVGLVGVIIAVRFGPRKFSTHR